MNTLKRKAALNEERSSKKQKHPSSYWEPPSILWLTSRALQEQERRCANLPPTVLCITPPSAISLQRFARSGGPDLSDLRGYSAPTASAMPPSRTSARRRRTESGTSSGRTSSRASGRTSAYDRNFEQHLIDHRVYPYNKGAKPDNWLEINRRLSQPRASLSPSRFSDGAFERFQAIDDSALTEAKVMSTVFPIIIGTDTTNIPSEQSLLFNNLEPLTDGSLVDAKPDFYDGTELQKIHPEVRDNLGVMIVPSSLQHAPSLPNFFVEAKGPEGSAAVAKRQACYNGALGARGMTSMLQFRQPSTPDHNAVTVTSTLHTSHLTLYTTHVTDWDSKDGPKYHMSQLRSFSMTDTASRFREGASAFRNLREWAVEQRERAISIANMGVTYSSQTSASEIQLVESDTSVGSALRAQDDLARESLPGA